jgi:hypothetical protein
VAEFYYAVSCDLEFLVVRRSNLGKRDRSSINLISCAQQVSCCVSLDNTDFILGKAIEFIHQRVDLSVGGVDLALDQGLVVRD